jgi:hypothetical protein
MNQRSPVPGQGAEKKDKEHHVPDSQKVVQIVVEVGRALSKRTGTDLTRLLWAGFGTI